MQTLRPYLLLFGALHGLLALAHKNALVQLATGWDGTHAIYISFRPGTDQQFIACFYDMLGLHHATSSQRIDSDGNSAFEILIP